MFRNFGKAVTVIGMMVLAIPALAQNSPLAQQGANQWRASKLVGVAIYGPDNKSVGKISDILMSKDGKAEYIVIGVGGILGIGEKDVALPYDQVKFSDQSLAPMTGAPAGTMAPSGASATGAAAPDGGVAPAPTVGLGAPAAGSQAGATAMSGQDAAGSIARSTSYPDHGNVEMSADQLKNAPTFQYAK